MGAPGETDNQYLSQWDGGEELCICTFPRGVSDIICETICNIICERCNSQVLSPSAPWQVAPVVLLSLLCLFVCRIKWGGVLIAVVVVEVVVVVVVVVVVGVLLLRLLRNK